MTFRLEYRALAAALMVPLLGITPSQAQSQRIENNVAVFAALDKVTARIKKLEVPLNETIEFGALKVTPRVCYSRPSTERPKTSTFVEVTETELDGSEKPLFTGWMFAESPGLNAVEHPVFDVWLTECAKPVNAPPPATVDSGEGGQAVERQPASDPPQRRRRIRR